MVNNGRLFSSAIETHNNEIPEIKHILIFKQCQYEYTGGLIGLPSIALST